MRYRAAIIGCGRVAWMLEDDPLEIRPCTHMGAYTAPVMRERGIEVVAACDTDPVRLEEFGRRYGVRALYRDYREMLRREKPDVLSICAYATERREMVMDALRAGVRGIWCEKAFAASVDEAALMTRAVEDAGAALIVSHSRRFNEVYAKVKEIVDSGGIGELKYIVSHFSGSLLHTGTHAFDVMRMLAGPITWVEGSPEESMGAFVWDRSADRGGRAFVGFEGTAYGVVCADTRAYFLFEFDVVGTSGRIRVGNNEVLEYYRAGPSRHYTGLDELHIQPFPSFEEKNTWVAALENLLDVMEGRAENRSGPEDGLRALETGIAVHVSGTRGGARVGLPLRGAETAVRVESR